MMQSNNFVTFDIRAFLDDLCGNIAILSSTNARGIALTAEADPQQTDLDFVGPLGLLVTELVTGAFARYGAGESGRIKVSVRRGNVGRLALTVDDDARARTRRHQRVAHRQRLRPSTRRRHRYRARERHGRDHHLV